MQFICYLKRDFSRLLINRSPSCSQFSSLCLIFRRIFTIDGKLFIHLISIAISAKNTVTLPRKIFSRKTGGAGNLRWLRLIYDRRDVTLPTSPLLLQQLRPEMCKTAHWRAERDQPQGSSRFIAVTCSVGAHRTSDQTTLQPFHRVAYPLTQ